MRRPSSRGFTLIEMAVTIAIIAILIVLAWDRMSRSRPRATFESSVAELQSLIHAARQQALASGVPVGVLVFPDFANGGGTGRIVVIQDEPLPGASFFSSASAVNFVTYDPAVLATTANGKIIAQLDLPSGVRVGPATGLGQPLLFPYASIPVEVACDFCTAGGDRRGAIVFDSRGRSRFWRIDGGDLEDVDQAAPAPGHSFSIQGTELGSGSSVGTGTLVITRPQGAVRIFRNG